jgi:small subunit ribosomal protein S8
MMIITDNIANFLSKLINGSLAKKEKITHYRSKKIIKILDICLNKGLIRNYSFLPAKNNKQFIEVYLKYQKNQPIIKKMIMKSKPSKLSYVNAKGVFSLNKTYPNSLIFISTSKGFMTTMEAAQFNVGGTLICQIN